MGKKTIMVFGVGELQRSIILKAKEMEFFVVGIDPCEDAFCRDEVDAFELVDGQDYEGHCKAIEKHNVSAIVTAATDKPLVMMARLATKYGFPFYSEETAVWSTDKFLMKQHFIEGNIACAQGRLIHCANEAHDLYFPLICKPRDNSGSRGVKLCHSMAELQESIDEALQFSNLDSVLVEEFIEGQEYSIESIHYKGENHIIQFTEKKTTPFPYNVELGHIQPANLTKEQRESIHGIITKISNALHFDNCPSHTELKINDRGIFVIETSPRLGGDYITSTLTPLSTGVDIEKLLLHISMGNDIDTMSTKNLYSGVRFFSFDEGVEIRNEPNADTVKSWPYVIDFDFKLKKGDKVNRITSSLNRYGQIILQTCDRVALEETFDKYEKLIKDICL